MNSQEIINDWVEYVLPQVKALYEQDGIMDKPARRESFANYIDELERAGPLAH